MDLDRLRRVIDVNLLGALLTARETAAASAAARRRGRRSSSSPPSPPASAPRRVRRLRRRQGRDRHPDPRPRQGARPRRHPRQRRAPRRHPDGDPRAQRHPRPRRARRRRRPSAAPARPTRSPRRSSGWSPTPPATLRERFSTSPAAAEPICDHGKNRRDHTARISAGKAEFPAQFVCIPRNPGVAKAPRPAPEGRPGRPRGEGTAAMNIHEYQAKQLLKEYGAPVSDGRVGAEGRGGQDRRGRDRRPDLGGQGADPRRRPRQGQVQGGLRRREGRRARHASRSPRPPRRPRRCSAAPSSPTRPAPAGKAVNRVYIEDGSDIARELYLALLIDRGLLAHRLRLLDRGRHGHRGGRGQDPREDPRASPSIPPPASPASTAAASPSPSGSRAGRSSSASTSSTGSTGSSPRRTPRCWRSTR